MRRLVLALVLLGSGCLDLDHLMHLHDFGELDLGTTDLEGVDQAAGTFTWTGPVAGAAGSVTTVRVVKNTTYLATPRGGIWTSTDDGPWSWFSATLPQRTIADVALDGVGSVYAATSAGVWKSTDHGATWAMLAGSPNASALAVAGSEPDARIYAGTTVGVSVSLDSGATWAPLSNTTDLGSTGPTNTHALELVPGTGADDDVLYAGAVNGPFVHSGGTWTGAATGVMPKQVVALALAGNTLYAGESVTTAGVTSGSLYKATVGATTTPLVWSLVSLVPIPTGIQALAWDGTTLYASSLGTARYTIAGTTTSATTIDDKLILSLAVTPSGTLCAAGFFGSASATGGGALALDNTGLHNTQISTIADVTESMSTLYAGSLAGQVVRTTDTGSTWTTESTGLVIGAIRVLSPAPVTNTRAYAGGDTGLWATTNTGAAWTLVGSTGVPPTSPVTAFASDPSAENTIYAGSPDGVHESVDGGTSWTLLAGSPTHATSILVTTHALYIAGSSAVGDGGVGLPVVMRSIDGGATLELADDGLPGVTVTQLLGTGTTTDTVYAATQTDGIYRSTDGATTWAPSNTGLGNTMVRGLAFNPNTPALMYAATASGVFASVDGGSAWSNVTKNLGNTDVTSIAVSGTVVFVGTNGDGVFYGN